MTRVVVSEHVLRWAMDRSGISPSVFERKFPNIRQWVEGKVQPTIRQLEELARTTSTPFGFFFLQEPPKEQLPIPHFRTISDDSTYRPSPNLLETVQIMEQRQTWMREFMREEGQKPLPFVGSINPDEDIQSITKSIRDNLGFEKGWASKQSTWTNALDMLRRTIEMTGILVVVNGIVANNTHRKLDTNEFRGFVLVDEYAPLVFVNGADGKAAQMFTLAHELAHVWLGSSAAFDLRELRPSEDPIEQKCNKVAAEFLVAEEELRQIWPDVRNENEPFQIIARRFKISVLVAARRALDLQLINKSEFLDFYHDYQEDERRRAIKKPDGGNFYNTQNLRIGLRFAHAVMSAAREGRLLYKEAYHLTGLHGKSFERYSERLGIGVNN
ncbi:MAG: ImmA/IrrE family metallo-endopeptidase [Candidatus Electryonea clarkiae]|nr:ImmA/IrrE family metallo-endopeptidase [Candidatus Electryonea clarkiae]MDP8288753.1 ImmA/IrrE family metallo-endopeptidase [Candidatus Electryonea clarkiae]